MKKLTREDLLNWWLTKFFNTTVKEVVEKYPKSVLESVDWFKLFPVTEKQHNEWENWAKKELVRTKTIPNKESLKYSWGLIYLDTAPYVEEKN